MATKTDIQEYKEKYDSSRIRYDIVRCKKSVSISFEDMETEEQMVILEKMNKEQLMNFCVILSNSLYQHAENINFITLNNEE